MHRTDKCIQHSPIIWTAWLHGWLFFLWTKWLWVRITLQSLVTFSPFFVLSINFFVLPNNFMDSNVCNSSLYPSFVLDTNLLLILFMQIWIGVLVYNVSYFLWCTEYDIKYLTLNKNRQTIQTHHSMLELLFWVLLFFGFTNIAFILKFGKKCLILFFIVYSAKCLLYFMIESSSCFKFLSTFLDKSKWKVLCPVVTTSLMSLALL